MKKLSIFIILSLFILTSCDDDDNYESSKSTAPLIGKKDLQLTSDIMTPEVLWSFGRVGNVAVSLDNSTILFKTTYYDIDQNKSNGDFYTIKSDGTGLKQITSTKFSEYEGTWRPDGKKIGFISYESGSAQLWEMNPDGTERDQISEFKNGINGFKYAPDQSKILFIQEVKVSPDVHDLHPDLPKASGMIFNDLMYRHWDHFVEGLSHVFVADYNGVDITNVIDILADEPYESPNAPFGGMEQINWSPDSKTIAYTCRKKTGKEYSISTNSDIYLYDVASGNTNNISEGMMGYDMSPTFSPDGKMIAWESMERDGYEADQIRLWVYDIAAESGKDYTSDFDQHAEGLAWAADSKSVYFTSVWHATRQIYRLDIAENNIAKITNGVHDYRSVIPAGDQLIGARVSMSMPVEIFSVNPETGDENQLSFVNKDLLGQLSMGKVEERWVSTTDNKQMLVWVIYPPHFDPNKKYPTLLYCKGGPQGALSQSWSFRWNYQIMAANGYIIVAPNRRGVAGFGQEWEEQISTDYHGQNIQDYLSAIDELAKEPFVDETRLGAIGASYGGYSVFYLAGNHEKRFKAFIAHDGIFNMEAQYLETEEMWFANFDMGGAFWDKKNKAAQNTYANSPHKFVDNWDTPILVIHGEKDYRVDYSQGMMAFNAAILKGVPAEFLSFPDENHWVLKPQNGILWQRTYFNWLDKWLKD